MITKHLVISAQDIIEKFGKSWDPNIFMPVGESLPEEYDEEYDNDGNLVISWEAKITGFGYLH